MKTLKLMMLAMLAACFGGARGLRTANAAKADAPPVDAPPVDAPPVDASPETAVPAPEADHSTLGLLCKGAGVDPEDVRWRVRGGLDVKQAVDAAVAQKENDARKGGK